MRRSAHTTTVARATLATATLAAGLAVVALPLAGPAGAADLVGARIDFGPAGVAPADGYLADTGLPFDAARGFGWRAEATGTPLDLSAQTRQRNLVSDRRADTVVQLQPASGAGVWELAVPAGTYDVHVGVGDKRYLDSTHRVRVEGVVAIAGFTPTTTDVFRDAVVRVEVTDGALTVDAVGGTNTKFTYLDVDQVPDPAPATPLDRIDFAPAGAPTLAGARIDSGLGYSSSRGYGWVQQTGSSAVSLSGQAKRRNANAELALDTTLLAQASGGPTGRWERAVPAGTYDVTVGVGDASATSGTPRVAVEGVVAIGGVTLSPSVRFARGTARATVTDGRLTLDLAGGVDTRLTDLEIRAVATTPTTTTTTTAAPTTTTTVGTTPPVASTKVDFTTPTATLPSGYQRDDGLGFDAARGYGWLTLDGTTPLDLSRNGRERDLVTDQRLDTFVHAQYAGGTANGTKAEGRWELAVADGTYDVTVAAGDVGAYYDSRHVVAVEGTTALDFVPTSANRTRTATVRVTVADGRLTLAPTGGSNTKVGYVDVTLVATGPTTTTTTSSTTTTSTTTTTTTVPPTTTTTSTTPPPTTTTTTVPTGPGGQAVVDGLDTFLGTGPRLVFSTVDELPLPGRTMTVRNTGTTPLAVSSTAITGNQRTSFRLANGTPSSFTLAPGASQSVVVEFRPPSFTIISNATLTFATSDPAQPTIAVALGAMDAYAFEGSSEPKLSQILKVLGYTTAVGVTAPNVATTRAPEGEEVLSQYWLRADTTKPAQLIPLARYVSRSEEPSATTSWKRVDGTGVKLYDFAGGDITSFGGENQKLLPVPTGNPSFNPGGPFHLGMYFNEDSDDGRNSGKVHNFRFYPARDHNGVVLADTWLVGHDKALTGKNFDYQDEVFLLVNAKPQLDPAAAAPGSASLSLDFGSAKPGTVADAGGQGTGFTSVQPNTAGNQLDAAKLQLDPAAGVLRVASSSGTSSGTTNTQRNALGLTFDATRGYQVLASIPGPLTNLALAKQHQAVWVGQGQDDYVKFEVEQRGTGLFLVLFAEQGGVGKTIGTPMAISSSVSSLDLVLLGDVGAGTITAAYRIGGGALTTYATAVAPTDVMAWFSRQATGGVLVANEVTPTSFTATFDRVAVLPR